MEGRQNSTSGTILLDRWDGICVISQVGINDGYLTPFKVMRFTVSISEYILEPDKPYPHKLWTDGV